MTGKPILARTIRACTPEAATVPTSGVVGARATTSISRCAGRQWRNVGRMMVMAGAKKHVMSVSVEQVGEADGSFTCQMCGKGHGAGAYLVRIELPLHAMSVQGSKELRLGLNCAR